MTLLARLFTAVAQPMKFLVKNRKKWNSHGTKFFAASRFWSKFFSSEVGLTTADQCFENVKKLCDVQTSYFSMKIPFLKTFFRSDVSSLSYDPTCSTLHCGSPTDEIFGQKSKKVE